MKKYLALWLMIGLAGCGTPPSSSDGVAADGLEDGTHSTISTAEANSRRFELEYAATFHDLPEGKTTRFWMPIPQDDFAQSAKIIEEDFPTETSTALEDKYGNKMLSFATDQGGRVSFKIRFEITRREVRAGDAAGEPLSDDAKKLFLAANEMVPTSGKPLTLLEGLELEKEPLPLGRQLYLKVDDHMQYSKDGEGWGRGDSVWACDSKYGNCTDFHSLFISLARSKGLPAKFEIGFPLPPERGEGNDRRVPLLGVFLRSG